MEANALLFFNDYRRSSVYTSGQKIGRIQMNRRQFLVAGSVGVMSAGCSAGTTKLERTALTGLTAIQERKAMPAFSLPNIDGNIVQSKDLLGNVAILRFWATW